jgi:hypothetical protein
MSENGQGLRTGPSLRSQAHFSSRQSVRSQAPPVARAGFSGAAAGRREGGGPVLTDGCRSLPKPSSLFESFGKGPPLPEAQRMPAFSGRHSRFSSFLDSAHSRR